MLKKGLICICCMFNVFYLHPMIGNDDEVCLRLVLKKNAVRALDHKIALIIDNKLNGLRILTEDEQYIVLKDLLRYRYDPLAENHQKFFKKLFAFTSKDTRHRILAIM